MIPQAPVFRVGGILIDREVSHKLAAPDAIPTGTLVTIVDDCQEDAARFACHAGGFRTLRRGESDAPRGPSGEYQGTVFAALLPPESRLHPSLEAAQADLREGEEIYVLSGLDHWRPLAGCP